MRLKSKIWVQAFLRSCDRANISAMVRCSGDADAGAIYIKVDRLDGTACLYVPAPTGFSEPASDRIWTNAFADEVKSSVEIETYMARQREFDDDLWWIEIERADGEWQLPG